MNKPPRLIEALKSWRLLKHIKHNTHPAAAAAACPPAQHGDIKLPKRTFSKKKRTP